MKALLINLYRFIVLRLIIEVNIRMRVDVAVVIGLQYKLCTWQSSMKIYYLIIRREELSLNSADQIKSKY